MAARTAPSGFAWPGWAGGCFLDPTRGGRGKGLPVAALPNPNAMSAIPTDTVTVVSPRGRVSRHGRSVCVIALAGCVSLALPRMDSREQVLKLPVKLADISCG